MTTIVTRAGKGSALTYNEMDANFNNLNNDKLETSTAATTYTTKVDPATSGTLTHSGDIVLSGTGKRITGDFSNATVADQVMFQSSTVNGSTMVGAIPNGTAQNAQYRAHNGSDPNNAAFLAMIAGTSIALNSGAIGAGVVLPLDIVVNAATRFRFGTEGQLGVAGANYGTEGQVIVSGGPSAAPSWGTVSGVPAGTVIHTASSTAPTGFLKANGALISRTTYAALFAVIGTTFGVGDGSTTFALPDLRGEFLRGLDDGRGVDAERVLGSAQSDEFKAHIHDLRTALKGSSGSATVPYNDGTAFDDGSLIIAPAGGNETRPRNIALLACIKF